MIEFICIHGRTLDWPDIFHGTRNGLYTGNGFLACQYGFGWSSSTQPPAVMSPPTIQCRLCSEKA